MGRRARGRFDSARNERGRDPDCPARLQQQRQTEPPQALLRAQLEEAARGSGRCRVRVTDEAADVCHPRVRRGFPIIMVAPVEGLSRARREGARTSNDVTVHVREGRGGRHHGFNLRGGQSDDSTGINHSLRYCGYGVWTVGCPQLEGVSSVRYSNRRLASLLDASPARASADGVIIGSGRRADAGLTDASLGDMRKRCYCLCVCAVGG